VSKERIIKKTELERTWKEVVVTYFAVLFILLEDLENHKTFARTADVRAAVKNSNLPRCIILLKLTTLKI
jgi:hypothetical protein